MAAEITKRIDAIVASHIAPLFKAKGFKKHGQRFIGQEDNCTQVVEVRRWQYNIDDHGKFSFDLGIYFPEWDQLARQFGDARSWDPLPKVLATWCCYVRERLDALCRERLNNEWWWEVKPDTDIDALGLEVAQIIEELVFPWLAHKSDFGNAVADMSEFAEKLRGCWMNKILCMLGWAMLGNSSKARALFLLAMEDEPGKDGRTVAGYGAWLEGFERGFGRA